MTEKYLHYLWKSKQFPLPQTTLTNGEEIIVKNVGEYNEHLKGPDFSFGSIQYREAVEYGSIEIHINSSDWYAHNHHLDPNYDNVILHVVYQNDKQVIQSGRAIPTLELKDYVEKRTAEKKSVDAFFSRNYPCANAIEKIDEYYLNQMLNNALLDKFSFKTKKINELNSTSDFELFYHFLALGFGMKINQNAFLELIKKIPFNLILPLTKSERRRFVLLQAEIMANETQDSLWHMKGTRPNAFPKKRIAEFAELISGACLELNWWSDIQRIDIKHCRVVLSKLDVSNVLSKQFENSLLINVFAPFLWQLGEIYSNEVYQEKAFEILDSIPAEKNSEVLKASCLISRPKNAFETQGLIALNRYYCSRKKCLSCHVGNKVLNRSI